MLGDRSVRGTEPYTIVLADDHLLIREGLKRILSERVDLEIVGEAGNGVQLLNLLKKFIPNLVILDVFMPKLNGFEVTREIKKLYPDTKVLILTMHKSHEYLQHALSAGADGYSLKEDATAEILSAVEAIRGGGVYVSPLLAKT